jgi:hypothetical protein
MFWEPAPLFVVAGSKPRPSSTTSKCRIPPSSWSRMTTDVASAYFEMFWSASRTQK